MFDIKQEAVKHATEYDFPKDYASENGMYQHKCLNCNHEFIGHKYRKICKICQNDSVKLAKKV